MLKNKRILLTILLALLLLLIPIMVNAADGEVNMTSIEVTTPSGVYGVGQEVTIRVNFDKAVKGNMPKLQIYFANGATKELTVSEVTTPVNYVDYTYTIVSGDNGKIRLYDSDTTNNLSDELGNSLTINKTYDLTGNTVMADTTIVRGNLANAEFEWVPEYENTHEYLNLIMKNVTIIEGNSYYVHCSNNKNENLDPLDYDNPDIWYGAIVNSDNSLSVADEYIASLNADTYISICEVDNTYEVPKILLNGQKVERKAQLPIGRRIKAYFFNDYTSTFCYEPNNNNNNIDHDRKINIKIGMITDTSILKAIKNGEANALQRLLEYSKAAEAFYTGAVELGRDDSVVSNLHLLNEEYYYVYFELDNENGEYYPVEDVSLYQGCVGDTIGVNLFNYLDDDFVWNLDEEVENNQTPTPEPETTPEPEKTPAKTEDKTKAPGSLPYTGGTFVIIVSVLAIIALGIYAYRRNNDLKGI